MIRSATPADVPAIASLIRALAEYEKLSDMVVLDEIQLSDHLFGKRPYAECLIAQAEDAVVGFALFFHNYSTFLGKPGIYLEDLFVLPEHRGAGYGKALLAEIGKVAAARDCGRIEWSVLDWNSPAIGFYDSLGAKPVEGWTVYRMTSDRIRKLAE
jgi:GNAT superfamily N-acetyltransferase